MCCGLYTVDSFWYQKMIVLQLQLFLVGQMQAEQRSITLQSLRRSCPEAFDMFASRIVCLIGSPGYAFPSGVRRTGVESRLGLGCRGHEGIFQSTSKAIQQCRHCRLGEQPQGGHGDPGDTA